MLSKIPSELLVVIIQLLPWSDIRELLLSSRAFYEAISSNEYLWQLLIHRDNLSYPGDEVILEGGEACFEVYKVRCRWVNRLMRYLDELSEVHLSSEIVEINSKHCFYHDLFDPNARKYGTLELIENTLITLKCSNMKYTRLTKRYYSNHVLTHLKHIQLSAQLKEFLEHGKSYFQGAVLVSQWIGASYREYRACAPVYEIVADIANKAKAKMNDNDPIETKLDRINESLFYDYKMSRTSNEDYYRIDNSRIDKVLYLKQGIPLTLSILYHEVARLCGVSLQTINFPRHFLLGFTASSGVTEYVDVFNKGKRITRDDCLHLCPVSAIPDSEEYFRVGTRREVLARMVRNVLNAHQNYDIEDILHQIYFYRLMYLVDPSDRRCLQIAAQISRNIGIKPDFVTEQLIKKLPQEEQDDYYKQLDKVVAKNKQYHMPRLEHPSHVTYHVGSVKLHKRYHYYCVIYGWDTECKLGRDWEIQMGIASLSNGAKQPFYHVLVEDGTMRYAAQENLVDTHATPIPHRNIGKYFESFDGEKYNPNSAVRKIYPLR